MPFSEKTKKLSWKDESLNPDRIKRLIQKEELFIHSLKILEEKIGKTLIDFYKYKSASSEVSMLTEDFFEYNKKQLRDIPPRIEKAQLRIFDLERKCATFLENSNKPIETV